MTQRIYSYSNFSVINFIWIIIILNGLGGQSIMARNAQNGISLINNGLANQINAESSWINPSLMFLNSSGISLVAGMEGNYSNGAFGMQEPSLYQAITNNQYYYPGFFYVMGSLSNRFKGGLAINKSYTNQIAWQPENWAGRYLMQENNFNTLVMQPALAFKVNDKWTLGAGVIMMISDLQFSRALPYRSSSASSMLQVTTNSEIFWGINAGVTYQVADEYWFAINLKWIRKPIFEEATYTTTLPSSIEYFFIPNNSLKVIWPVNPSLEMIYQKKMSETLRLSAILNYQLVSNGGTSSFDFLYNNPFLEDIKIEKGRGGIAAFNTGASWSNHPAWALNGSVFYSTGNLSTTRVFPDLNNLQNFGITTGIVFSPVPTLSIELSLVALRGYDPDAFYEPANFGGTYVKSLFKPSLAVNLEI